MANAIVESKQETGIATYCANPAVRQSIVNVVGENEATQFIASLVSAVQTNKELMDCTNKSLFSAALLGQSLKLSPSPQLGQFYLVPYKDRKTGIKEATFQIGAKGYKQLAIRSGQYRKIVTSVIKSGELKSYNPITEEYVFQPVLDPEAREKLPVIGYYASFVLNNGFQKELYWSKEKMQQHAMHYSQGYRSDVSKGTAYTFWSKDFDGMAEKTMIRQLISKWGIMSIEMQKAYESDMGVLSPDEPIRYVDNQSDPEEVSEAEIAMNANRVELVIEGEAVE